MATPTINNYDLRRPYRQRNKTKWLVLIHYGNNKHHLFFTYETERQLLRRIKSICYQATDKIAYVNVYDVMELPNNETRLNHYGEFTYRNK